LLATILALTASTAALPAIANSISGASINEVSTSRHGATDHVSAIPSGNTGLEDSGSATFTQRSLNIAKRIPNNAIGLVFVDIDPRSWKIPDQQAPLITQSPLFAIDKLFSFLLQSPDFSIAKDLQPWLGTEVAIAVLGNDTNQGDLGFAALAPVVDDQQYDIFVAKLEKLNLPKPTETLYKKVRILEWQLPEKAVEAKPPERAVGPAEAKPEVRKSLSKAMTFLERTKQAKLPPENEQKPENPPKSEQDSPTEPSISDFRIKRFAIAKLPSGLAIIATNSQTIQQAIDLSAPRTKLPSIANSQLFLRSLNNPLWNRSLITGYGDFKGFSPLIEILAADLPETSEIPGFSRAEYIQGMKYTLGQYSSFELFTWLTPKGLRSQSSSYFSEVRSPKPTNREPRDLLLSLLPSNVYGSISSRNLNYQWQWFVNESKLQPTYKIFVEGLKMIAPIIAGSGVNLDIEKDIISWIDGEYAVVAFPSESSPLKEINSDLTFGALIRTSKPEAANAALDKLVKYANSFSKDVIQVKKRQIGATLLTSFEYPDDRDAGKTQSIFAYGWRDRQTLLLTLGASTASAFIPTPKTSLAESAEFRDAIADVPQPNFGYFYLNARKLAELGAKFFLFEFARESSTESNSSNKPSKPELPEPIQKVIDKLGGLVFVYSETSDRFQSDFFLRIKP
jgi:hypothetical protein